ncbi:hypothetical protein MNY64_17865 (plasmid) [Moellerella wisconsensis]|uniref:hypothetical protein n=1 Tax=Moellerella wisconsensis TaxID=158849 RepID=UPI001F4D3B65|nr:hypothetical protein [Moellerella wisconsensis]UNH29315.1 hypothetical protein MNY64_17865 [Moellerella wisconsensis]
MTKTESVKVTKLNGEVFISNIIKTKSKNHVLIFSDRRMLLAEISTIEAIPRHEFDEAQSETVFFDKSTLPKAKTFHLILNKAHAKKSNVAIFLKNGDVYKGKSINCDLDSIHVDTGTGQVLIMYDAVKRIVPLEDDGSLAE